MKAVFISTGVVLFFSMQRIFLVWKYISDPLKMDETTPSPPPPPHKKKNLKKAQKTIIIKP